MRHSVLKDKNMFVRCLNFFLTFTYFLELGLWMHKLFLELSVYMLDLTHTKIACTY